MQKAGKTQVRLVLGADCEKDRAWYEIDGGKREWVQVRGLVEAGIVVYIIYIIRRYGKDASWSQQAPCCIPLAPF